MFLGLYSRKYPAIGESHGLSVVAGSLRAAMPPSDLNINVIDMMQWGEESCTRAVKMIHRVRANMIAIGLPYGTFRVIEREYAALRSALYGTNPLIIFGGPIATYMSERILTEIAPESIVIRGEAEHILPSIVECWRSGNSISQIPNVHYIDRITGAQVETPRLLADLSRSRLPYREHIPEIHATGGQIYCESSRGCSWAACTFCLRGLTDIVGRSYEYRRKNPTIVGDDLEFLWDLGIEDVTFADEDFLGSGLTEAEEFVTALQSRQATFPRFDASLTVHSVVSRRDTVQDDHKREQITESLAKLGLQKVFLGIESCSPTQLKRYAKGHSREEAVRATRRLQQLGVRVEIGVILFDPLCTLMEVRESLEFMRLNNLVGLSSGLANDLRLQASSHYVAMLSNYERLHGLHLRDPSLDPDTLSYPYRFHEPAVARLFEAVNEWNTRLRPLYYPAKSLSRFGSTGAIGQPVHALRKGIIEFRNGVCDAIIDAIDVTVANGNPRAVLDVYFPVIAGALAECVIACLSPLRGDGRQHPVVEQAVDAARRVDALTNTRQRS